MAYFHETQEGDFLAVNANPTLMTWEIKKANPGHWSHLIKMDAAVIVCQP